MTGLAVLAGEWRLSSEDRALLNSQVHALLMRRLLRGAAAAPGMACSRGAASACAARLHSSVESSLATLPACGAPDP